jgi:hypothetical protein
VTNKAWKTPPRASASSPCWETNSRCSRAGRVACFEANGNVGPERNDHYQRKLEQNPAYFQISATAGLRTRRAIFALSDMKFLSPNNRNAEK